jgi:hypothetical protein
VKVFGHDDISMDDEAVSSPRFLQELDKEIASCRRAQLRPTPVTAAGNEVEILGPVITMESLSQGVKDSRPIWSSTVTWVAGRL